MNDNKTFNYSQICYVICIVLIYTYFKFKYGAVLLCDSVEHINEISNEEWRNTEVWNNSNSNSNNNDSNNDHSNLVDPKIGLIYRFKRRLFWYISERKSGKYNTYNDYKTSFNSDKRIWDIIKNDFNASRNSAFKANKKSLEDGSNIMNNVRESRIQSDIIRQNRRNLANSVNNTRK